MNAEDQLKALEWWYRTLFIVDTAKRTIKPWKKNGANLFYDKGWNDCLKETEKNYKRWRKELIKVVDNAKKEVGITIK